MNQDLEVVVEQNNSNQNTVVANFNSSEIKEELAEIKKYHLTNPKKKLPLTGEDILSLYVTAIFPTITSLSILNMPILAATTAIVLTSGFGYAIIKEADFVNEYTKQLNAFNFESLVDRYNVTKNETNNISKDLILKKKKVLEEFLNDTYCENDARSNCSQKVVAPLCEKILNKYISKEMGIDFKSDLVIGPKIIFGNSRFSIASFSDNVVYSKLNNSLFLPHTLTHEYLHTLDVFNEAKVEVISSMANIDSGNELFKYSSVLSMYDRFSDVTGDFSLRDELILQRNKFFNVQKKSFAYIKKQVKKKLGFKTSSLSSHVIDVYSNPTVNWILAYEQKIGKDFFKL